MLIYLGLLRYKAVPDFNFIDQRLEECCLQSDNLKNTPMATFVLPEHKTNRNGF